MISVNIVGSNTCYAKEKKKKVFPLPSPFHQMAIIYMSYTSLHVAISTTEYLRMEFLLAHWHWSKHLPILLWFPWCSRDLRWMQWIVDWPWWFAPCSWERPALKKKKTGIISWYQTHWKAKVLKIILLPAVLLKWLTARDVFHYINQSCKSLSGNMGAHLQYIPTPTQSACLANL